MFLDETNASGSVGTSATAMILVILVWIVVFYFILIRPQKKQKKQIEELHKAMEPGDNIMTTGGFYGTILDIVDDTTVIVEFGNNKNCRIPMHKNAIAEIEKAGSAIVKDDEDVAEEKTEKAEKASKKQASK
ncbi:MAG: preprotein translocase subunit YajC [Lachnospiraceae bacterium]|nr:preprotein translocase subunit YajC [Lachnospiraceae bacterium]